MTLEVRLTARELQLLQRRRKRIPYKQIADELNITQTRAKMTHTDAVNKLIDAALMAPT